MKKATSHSVKIFSLITIVGALLSFGVWETVFATAGVSNYLSYQGRLTDISGNPLGGAGTNYCFSFSVFDASSGGTMLWPLTATTTNILSVANGVFNASIGDVSTVNFSANDTQYLNVQVATQVGGVCTGVVWETLAPRQKLDSVAYARTAHDLYGGDVQVGNASGTSGNFLKLDWKNTADTLGGACSGSSASQGWLWFNSSSNFTRVCNNNIIKSLSGLTNDFFDITGPTTAAKTFTFPDASATVLTSAVAVTIAQGGTGTTTATNAFNALSPITTKGDLITNDATNDVRLAVGTNGQFLSASSTASAGIAWVTPTGGGDMVLASAQTNSGLKTFNDATLGLRNVANTFTSLFTNTNSAARTYTLPDVSGTVLTSGAAVTVAQGGTGLGTITLNNLIYGNGTSNALLLAPGATTGAVLMNTAAGAPSWALLSALPSTAGALPVANGGTGATTLTLNNVILGNGTTAPTFVAPGTAGNLLQSNGTTWTSAASGVLIGHRLITASPYTPTTGTNVIVVRIVGGGGGGAGATGIASGCSAGGGGGGSSYAEKRFAGIAGAASYTVTVGAAGGAGTATTNGGVGGNSTFVCPATCTGGAVTVTANGGLGGIYTLGIAGAKTFLGGAGGGVSTLGDVNTGGQPGGSGVCVSGTVGISGQGAPSQFGGGGTAKNTALAGTAGVGYGSGGGGGLSLSATGVAGGAGTAGVIVIDEYR